MNLILVIALAFIAQIVAVRVFDINIADYGTKKLVRRIEEKTKSNIRKEFVTPVRDSKYYRYTQYVQAISDAVTRMGLFGIKTSISFELFVSTGLLFSVTITLIVFLISKLAIMALCIFVASFISFNTFAYMYVRYNLFTLENDVIDAIDFVCPQIMDGGGVVESIEQQLPNMSYTVRENFKRVVDEVQYEGHSPVKAFDTLKRYLGPVSYIFADRSAAFIENETQGANKVFETIIARNETIKSYNLTVMRKASERLIEFYMILAMLMGMTFSTFVNSSTKEVVQTWLGQLLIGLVFVIAAYSNMKIQLMFKTAGGGVRE